MAGNKNQVTLTFAGDSSDLERSFDRVGSSSRDMGRDVRQSADRFDRMSEGVDTADTRAMGFRDTITGFQDLNAGLTGDFDSLGDQLFMLGMGFGDLASGVYNFGLEMARTVGKFIAQQARMVAAHMMNAARMAAGWLIAMGPIALVILAIGLIIGILFALGVDFEDLKNIAAGAWEWIQNAASTVFDWLKENWPLVLAILTGPFGIAVFMIVKHWQTIKDAASGAKGWIVDRFNDLVSFVTGLPGRMGRAASGLFDGIKDAFRSAVNWVIDKWNGLSFRIPGFDPPGPGPSFSGVTVSTPNIPRLHTGGTYRAPRGQREGLAMLLDGERVSRPGEDSGGMSRLVVDVTGADEEMARLIKKLLRTSRLEIA